MRFKFPLSWLTLVLLTGIIPLLYCCQSGSGTDQKVSLPDSLQTAQQFAQYGVGQQYQAWNFSQARAAFQKAIELDPQNSTAQIQYGWWLNLAGEDQEAKSHMAKATAADPQNPLWQSWQAWHCLWIKEYDCTEEHVNSALAIDPGFHWAHYVRGLKLIEQGKPEAAIPHMEKAYSGPQQKTGLPLAYAMAGDAEKARALLDSIAVTDNFFDYLGFAETYTVLGEQEAAFEWLEKAYAARHPFFPWVGVNPLLDPLKADSRFQDLLGRLDLPRGSS